MIKIMTCWSVAITHDIKSLRFGCFSYFQGDSQADYTYNSHNIPCDPNHLILTSKEDFPVLPVLLSDFRTFQDPKDSKGEGTASAPKVLCCPLYSSWTIWYTCSSKHCHLSCFFWVFVNQQKMPIWLYRWWQLTNQAVWITDNPPPE